jgi:hypothetical protein
LSSGSTDVSGAVKSAGEAEVLEAPAPKKPKPSKNKEVLPDWPALIATNPELWADGLRRAETGPRVLLATAIGGHPQFTVVESALAAALTLRGARADILVCDGVLPGCQRAKVIAPTPSELVNYGITERVCPGCLNRARMVFNMPGLNMLEFSAFLKSEDRAFAREVARILPADQLERYVYDGLPIGEHAKAGALRYYGIGDLALEAEGELVLRRYVEASLLTAFAMRRALKRGGYDFVVTNHGIYVPHGIISAVARQRGVPVAAWNTAYRRQCAIFSHGDTYHHTLMEEPTSAWEDMPWSQAHENEIMSYLISRRGGARDWIWFNRDGDEDVDRFAAEVGLDWSKPVIGMLSNVVWDAQLHYPANAFPDMLSWIQQTIAWFAARPDLQLLIRIHPGELAPPGGVTKSRQPAVEEIRKGFPELPKNVFVVPPENPLSTYAAMDRCDSVIIYGTKTGVELTSFGTPVIVAGEAWIRNKGLTRDAASVDDYFAILDTLPAGHRLDEATTRRARKYAYHFFFRRMVPLPFLDYVADTWPPFRIGIDRLDDLLPGRHPGLDVLCDGILKGKPFIYEAERLGLHDAAPSETG